MTQIERYRKLPGHRRGILRGASLWVGSDHLLLVRSVRFREEYKRFYFRDIQAITVADAPRFHISTRAIWIAWAWVVLYAFVQGLISRVPSMGWVPSALFLSSAIGVVLAWVYVSAERSCRCRIRTAVSHDELLSVYRRWHARRLLAQMEPLILAAQGGTIPEGWAESVEPAVEVEKPRAAMAALPVEARRPEVEETRSATSLTFVGSLLADGVLNFATLSMYTRTLQWIWYGLSAVEVGSAILIFVQHYRGVLSASMQKLAIATLIATGCVFYLRQVLASVPSAAGKVALNPALVTTTPGYMVMREVDGGLTLVLGVVGLVLLIGGRRD